MRVKKPIGFDNLIARVRAVAGALPDSRMGDNTQFYMAGNICPRSWRR